jgi:AAA+ superfamily predicted ATPase
MAPSNIRRSFILSGEELTPRTPIPVDKESSTPLAEVIFEDNLPSAPPLFSDNVKFAIESILNEWRNFEKLSKIKAEPSRSCLIYGAPGTGKTHLALWIAKQIKIPVVLAKLDGLMSSFLGTSSRNIGNLFSFASRYKCILLLDEFDAIAKLRNDPQEVGEIKRVVNTLLQNLDARSQTGFTIGITNHESLLDPAIWRRFNVQIEIPKPSIDVINKLLQKFSLPIEFNKPQIEFLTWVIEGASGADIESLVKWLKKVYAIETNMDFVNIIRRFAVLNSGRISSEKRGLLNGPDTELFLSLLSDINFNFSQKDISELAGIPQSTLSKQLSKNK